MKIFFFLCFGLLSIVTVLSETVEYIPDKLTGRRLRGARRRRTKARRATKSGGGKKQIVSDSDSEISMEGSNQLQQEGNPVGYTVIPRQPTTTEQSQLINKHRRNNNKGEENQNPDEVETDSEIEVHEPVNGIVEYTVDTDTGTTYFYNGPTVVSDFREFFDGMDRSFSISYRLWTTDERLAVTDLEKTVSFPLILTRIVEQIDFVSKTITVDRINIQIEIFACENDMFGALDDYAGQKFALQEGFMEPDFYKYNRSLLEDPPVHVYSKKREFPQSEPGTGWQASDVNASTIYLFVGGPCYVDLRPPDTIYIENSI